MMLLFHQSFLTEIYQIHHYHNISKHLLNMKKKIIISGGLGYIGTELCKLYSGVSWNHDIVVIDNRFISERVNQLRNWNIEFIHGDILDKDLIYKHCCNADIVHHLAGITDVPRVKSEANAEHEKLA